MRRVILNGIVEVITLTVKEEIVVPPLLSTLLAPGRDDLPVRQTGNLVG